MARIAHLVLIPAVGATLRQERTSNLAVLAFAVGLLAGVSLWVRDRWVGGASGALAGLALVALLHPPPGKLGVTVSGPTRVRVGDRVSFTVGLHNDASRRSSPFDLLVELSGCTPAVVSAPALSPGSGIDLSVPVTAMRRTRSRLTVTQRSCDPLRLRVRLLEVSAPVELAVLPPAVPPPTDRRITTPGEVARAGGRTALLAGVRPWRAGDNPRDVHWRATARHTSLVVVDRPLPPPVRELAVLVAGTASTVDDELVVAAAAALADTAARTGERLTLVGWTRRGRLEASSDWFAEREFVQPPIPDALAGIPAHARVAVACPADSSVAWREQLETALAARGQRLTWVEPAETDPERREVLALGLAGFTTVRGR